jgi:hypothetical protein
VDAICSRASPPSGLRDIDALETHNSEDRHGLKRQEKDHVGFLFGEVGDDRAVDARYAGGFLGARSWAIVLLGVVGIGNALIDVGGFTLLARLADETVLARMLAGFEAILTLGDAAGGLRAPLVIELLGVRLALVAIGLMAPLAVAASWPALRRLDAGMGVRDADIEILRGVRMLGALPAATIEQVGAGLEHADFVPRQTVFEQGERGERFYIVESGRAEVVRDGRVVETLGRGNCFGEIALLRDEPRTPPFAHPRTQTCA